MAVAPIPLRVLLLEDRPSDALLVVHALRQAGFEPAWQRVDTLADYLSHLDPQPDVILADYAMPQFTGLEGLRLLHERGLSIPFIMVTGSAGEDFAVTALHEGADDYLLKDRLARLGQAVSRALGQHRLREAKRKADQALLQSERWFRALIEQSADTVAVLDASASVLYASPTTARVLGYSASEFVGRNVMALVHPDERSKFNELFERLLQTPGMSLSGDFRCRHADRTWRWVEATVTNLLHDASVGGIVTNYRDIGERKRAEAGQRFLAEASRALAGSLEYVVTLQTVAELAVPLLGDVCLIDLVDDQGAIYRAAVAHAGGQSVVLAQAHQARASPAPGEQHPTAQVVHSGQPLMVDNLSPALLEIVSPDRVLQTLIRDMGPTSLLVVPLMSS